MKNVLLKVLFCGAFLGASTTLFSAQGEAYKSVEEFFTKTSYSVKRISEATQEKRILPQGDELATFMKTRVHKILLQGNLTGDIDVHVSLPPSLIHHSSQSSLGSQPVSSSGSTMNQVLFTCDSSSTPQTIGGNALFTSNLTLPSQSDNEPEHAHDMVGRRRGVYSRL